MEIRQRISIMPEAPGLYLRLTVAENLEYFAGLYGLRHPAPRIADALDAVNLGDRAGRPLRRPLQGPAPAGGAGPDAAERPGDHVPRRTDLGPRPGGGPRGARPDRRAPRAGSDDLPHHPPARRGREALRPGRHLEHDPAHHRPARRPAGPAVQAARSSSRRWRRSTDPGPALRRHRPPSRAGAPAGRAPTCSR